MTTESSNTETKNSTKKSNFLNDAKNGKIKKSPLSAQETFILASYFYKNFDHLPILINGCTPRGQSIIRSKSQSWAKTNEHFIKYFKDYPAATYLAHNWSLKYDSVYGDPAVLIARDELSKSLAKHEILVKELFTQSGIDPNFDFHKAADLTKLQLQNLQKNCTNP